MYRDGLKDGLKPDELEAARLGFNRYLRRKRFSPQFIARHAEELFAQATLEYSRKRAEGVTIDNPPGWLIECAWRRTKSQLEAEARAPHLIALERSGPLADQPGCDPEDALLESERYRKLRDAVGKLTVEQRSVLAFSYFEGLTVREAGRRLQWHSSKAQRAHEGAKERLRALLGVDSVDDLAIGLAAVVQSVRAGAKQLWARTHNLLGRFSPGNGAGGIEAAGAAASDGGSRLAETCKVLAVCLVGGTAALGGGQLVKHGDSRPQPSAQRPAIGTSAAGVESPPLSTLRSADALSKGSSTPEAAHPAARRSSEGDSRKEQKRRSDERQAEAQFGAFAKATSTEAPPRTTASVSSAATSPPPTEESTTASSHAPPAEEQQVREQFGAFK